MELRGKIIAIQDPPFSEDWSGMEEVEVVIELDDSRKFVFPDTGNNIRARYPIGKTLTVKFDIDAIDMGEIWTNRIIVHNIVKEYQLPKASNNNLFKQNTVEEIWQDIQREAYMRIVKERLQHDTRPSFSGADREWIESLLDEDPQAAYEKVQLLGDVHYFDKIKKKIIKERYDIDWKTPSERYPGVLRD